MDVFGQMEKYDYGEVFFARDAASGMRAIVTVHDSRLGPALGGARFLSYAEDEDALVDALRLARGMTYKAALARVPHGGGKGVIIKPTAHFDRVAIFRAFGRFVESLGGYYITAEDSGTGLEDMEIVRTMTKYVTGVDIAHGGSGDPSPFTAFGVRRGIEACVKHKLGRDSLDGVRVAVQGVGHVGYHLCKELHGQGAKLFVADVDPLKAERAEREFDATVVPLDAIFDTECEVLSPCALGSALANHTVSRIKAKIVAGAANNQLALPKNGDDLHARGILYAPDYAINAGGLINVAQEVVGYDPNKARDRIRGVYDTILEICERSEKSGTPTYRIADMMVEERLAQAGKDRAPRMSR